MTELKKILSIYLDLYLHQIIISGARTKEGASKIRIRPVVMKDNCIFSVPVLWVRRKFMKITKKSVCWKP